MHSKYSWGSFLLPSLLFPLRLLMLSGDISSVLLRIICQQHTWLQQWLHQIIWYRRLKDSPTQRNADREKARRSLKICVSLSSSHIHLSLSPALGVADSAELCQNIFLLDEMALSDSHSLCMSKSVLTVPTSKCVWRVLQVVPLPLVSLSLGLDWE